MEIRPITKDDFDEIVEVIDRWWGGPISTFAHPIFFYELGDKAIGVHDENGRLIGFLLGFVAHSEAMRGHFAGAHERTGYVHLVGIHPDFRRRGVGRLLYERFTEMCRAAGCKRMKAITTLGYDGSRRFHVALGWNEEEAMDYAGPDRHRIVFTKELEP